MTVLGLASEDIRVAVLGMAGDDIWAVLEGSRVRIFGWQI